jgi:MFS family permease
MGTLTDKLGCRAVSVTGVLLNTVGTLPFLWMVENHYSPVLMALCMFARGAGQGSVGVPSLSAGYAAVPREKLALATTAANIVQRLGGPIATTALTIVIALSASSPAPAIGQREFFVPFLALIFLQLTVLGSASRLPLRIHQNPAGDA